MKMKKWSSQWTQFMLLLEEVWKKNSGLQRGLNPWSRDYRCDALLTELWSHWRWEQVYGLIPPFSGFISYIKEMSVNDILNKSFMNCGNEMKMKKWSSQWTKFMQMHEEPEKNSRLQRGLSTWPHNYWCDALPTDLWSHWRWEQVNCGFKSSRERCGSQPVDARWYPKREIIQNDIRHSKCHIKKWLIHGAFSFVKSNNKKLTKKFLLQDKRNSLS